jgi:hypothetical protein
VKAKYTGILAAAVGSICCIGPLLLVALGLGAGAPVIGRYHWLFVICAIAVLTWAWIKYFREKARCACEHRAMGGRGASLFTLLFASVIVLTFAGLNVRSFTFAGSPPAVPIARANLQRVIVPVEGMTVAGCELMALPGVFSRKRPQLACLIFSPLDRLERKLRNKSVSDHRYWSIWC